MHYVHREHPLGVLIHYIELLVGRVADTLYVALIFPHNIAGFGELAHLPDAPPAASLSVPVHA